MTEYVSPLAFANNWLRTDTDTLNFMDRYMDASMKKIVEQESKFLASLKRGGEVNSTKPEWMEQRGYPRKITATASGGTTLTFSGTFNGSAITAELMKQIIRTGTILEKYVDGLPKQVKITDTNFADLAVSAEAYGNTTWANDESGAIEYDIVSEPSSDDDDWRHPRWLPRSLRYTFTQIWQEFITVTQTEQDEAQLLVTNPLERQVQMLLRKIKDAQAMSAIRGRPYYDTGTGTYLAMRQGVKDPTMAGVLWWAGHVQTEQANTRIYVNAQGQSLDRDMISNAIDAVERTEFASLKTGRWEGWCSPDVRPWINRMDAELVRTDRKEDTVGTTKTKIEVDNGFILPVDTDLYFPSGHFIAAPMETIEWGNFKNGGLKRVEISSQGAGYRKWALREHTYGTKPDNPRWIVVIYNIAAAPSAS